MASCPHLQSIITIKGENSIGKQRKDQHPALRRRIVQWLRQATVQSVLPVVIGLGLLAYVSSVALAPRSSSQLWVVLQHTWLVVLFLTVPYLVARALVWHELLMELGINTSWRQLAVAFAGGELTKSLPAGVYTQNYLLGRLERFGQLSLVRSSTATTAMLGLETLLAVPVVLIIGIPGFSWLFWTLIGIIAAWIVVLAVAWLLAQHWAATAGPGRRAWLRRGSRLAKEFLEAAAELVAPRTLLTLVPTALYMLIYVIELYAITRAVGVHNVTFVHTMAIYGVIVLAVVLIPIPTELGITEFTGLGALEAFGVPGSTAAIIMLSLRLLATGMTIVVAGVLFFLLRGELAAARKVVPTDVSGGETAAS